MTPQDIRAAFLEELTHIAPDLDAATIADTDHIQDDLQIDSMDFLRLVSALHVRLGVDIPESDYRHLATPHSAVAYLQGRLA